MLMEQFSIQILIQMEQFSFQEEEVSHTHGPHWACRQSVQLRTCLLVAVCSCEACCFSLCIRIFIYTRCWVPAIDAISYIHIHLLLHFHEELSSSQQSSRGGVLFSRQDVFPFIRSMKCKGNNSLAMEWGTCLLVVLVHTLPSIFLCSTTPGCTFYFAMQIWGSQVMHLERQREREITQGFSLMQK